jgi:hypothetical protein
MTRRKSRGPLKSDQWTGGIVRSPQKRRGILLSLTEEPRQDLAWANGVRATMIGVRPDGQRLADIAKIIDEGRLRPLVHRRNQ